MPIYLSYYHIIILFSELCSLIDGVGNYNSLYLLVKKVSHLRFPRIPHPQLRMNIAIIEFWKIYAHLFEIMRIVTSLESRKKLRMRTGHWYWIFICTIKSWRCQLKRCENLLKRTNLNYTWKMKPLKNCFSLASAWDLLWIFFSHLAEDYHQFRTRITCCCC